MAAVIEQFKYSPEMARRRLVDFIDHAPELDTYDSFTRAVYTEHELPFAIASLYYHLGSPGYVSKDTNDQDGYSFFQQTGITQVKGGVSQDWFVGHAYPQRSNVSLTEARARILREPKVRREASLSLVSDGADASFDYTSDSATYGVVFGLHNVRAGQQFIEQTGAVELMSGMITDPEVSSRDMRTAAATLSKLSQKLLAVTVFERV